MCQAVPSNIHCFISSSKPVSDVGIIIPFYIKENQDSKSFRAHVIIQLSHATAKSPLLSLS